MDNLKFPIKTILLLLIIGMLGLAFIMVSETKQETSLHKQVTRASEFSTHNKIATGAFVGTNPPTIENIALFENLTGQNLSSVMWFQGWDAKNQPDFPGSELKEIVSNNNTEQPYVFHLTWEPAVNLKDIVNGNYDNYLASYAKSIKSWGGNIFFRFAHEMIQDHIYQGNEAYRWQDQPQDYVNAFRHVHDIFMETGASNAKFVWCPNNFPVDVNIVKQYYPGKDYVDWLCMDGYNWGNQNGKPGWPEWLWFDDIFANIYHTFVDHPEIFGDKPIMIGEFASCEATANELPGQNKAEWIKNAFERITSPDFQKIKAFHWFQINKECDWRINSSNASQTAFKKALQQNF